MTNLPELFALAHRHQRANEFRQAEKVYQQIVQMDSNNAQAWHQLGLVAQALKMPAEAESHLQRVLALQPDDAAARLHLANVLAEQGKLGDAAAQYQQVVRARPHDVEVWLGLANAEAGRGRLGPAIAAFEQVVRQRPDHVEAHTNLGIALARQRQLAEAVTHLQTAVRLRPDHAKAHNNLGVALAEMGKKTEARASWREAARLKPDYAEAFFNLAVSLAEERQFEEAIPAYIQAITIRPDYPEALNNLGLALTEQQRYTDAVPVLQQAIRLKPDYHEAHNNLALALVELGRYPETIASFQEALRLNPSYIEAHNNYGTALAAMGRTKDALAVYQVALWLKPDYAEVHWNRALAWLQTGDYARGWPEYEWRWKRKRARPRPFEQPRWDGQPLDGKTILIYCEQGMGDTIQFIRYAKRVQEAGGRVLVECPPELMGLLKSCPGIDQLVPERSELPPFDVQVPLLSLPGIFKTTLDTVPAEIPYLSVEGGGWRVEGERSPLPPPPSTLLKVGIAWQGNPKHRWDRHRSIPLGQFEPLARVVGVKLYSLQKGPGVEQLSALGGRFQVTDFGEALDGKAGPFMDTAAILSSLDLLITCDSVLCHLAGALGKPVWVAVSFLSDWRWMHGREDTPWYPTMRLFRQTDLGDWTPVFERMTGELARLVASRPLGETMPPESTADLYDRLARLAVERAHADAPEARERAAAEWTALAKWQDNNSRRSAALDRILKELEKVHEELFHLKCQMHTCEPHEPDFVKLARSLGSLQERRKKLLTQIRPVVREHESDTD
jgi:tetratricopeptide (TPR) repeat protein